MGIEATHGLLECREDGGVSAGAPPGPYAPSSCDVWSLGIILLSLITGRAPGNLSAAEVPALLAGLSTTSDAENALLVRTLILSFCNVGEG